MIAAVSSSILIGICVALGALALALAAGLLAVLRRSSRRAESRVSAVVSTLEQRMDDLAKELAGAVDRAEEEGRRSRVLGEIAGSINLDDVLNRTLEGAMAVTGADAALVRLTSRGDDSPIVASVGVPTDGAEPVTGPPDGTRPTIVQVSYSYSEPAEGLIHRGLAVPLIAATGAVGTLCVYTKDPDRFPGFNTPDPSYNGLVYGRDLGEGGALGANLSYILKARVQLLRDLGSAVAPFNAFLIAQGLETLSLRVERHVQNAEQVASWLEGHDDVESVAYAGLPSSRWFERGRKYGPKGTGAVVAFNIKGGLEAGKRFVDGLELHSHVANLGDVRSLVIHPASTTHAQLSPEQQLAAGVTPGLVRLSVGLENVVDILADLEAGFRAAKEA